MMFLYTGGAVMPLIDAFMKVKLIIILILMNKVVVVLQLVMQNQVENQVFQ